MNGSDDQLKNFLKAHSPEPPAASTQEFNEILAQIKLNHSARMLKGPIHFLKSGWVRFVAASLVLACVMGYQFKFISRPLGNAVSAPSEAWAAELISSELSNDDELPANQIGEDYLGLMADNASIPKE